MPLEQQKSPQAIEKLVDFSWLGRYTENDVDFELELLVLFEQQARRQLEQLRRLCGTMNHQEWHLASHTLKGTARSVGVEKIGNLAEQLEMMGPKAESDRLPRVLSKLERLVVEFERALADYRGNCLK